jgi:hypothetical protein
MMQHDLFGAPDALPIGAKLPTLTLWQPWASLIFSRVKLHETRSWPIPDRLYGRRIAIHASASLPPQRSFTRAIDALCAEIYGDDWRRTLPKGVVLGTCVLSGHVHTNDPKLETTASDRTSGDWSDGRWAWRLEDVTPLPVPIPAKGAQGIWNWTVSD